jgi:3-hydroxybutyryl-CoA dehydrogenase
MESSIAMNSRNFDVETIGIVGPGAMGRGVEQIAALAGLTVRLYDTKLAAVSAARDYVAETFARLTAKSVLGNPRYRRSPWLARRAQLGLSLTQRDAADIQPETQS